ncbi:FMN-binding glutamate synthase family protein [Peribacillus simplex]|uniref:FMN-binding glutamate synthase family protein n=1 Tax=Peribacillus simplex TaxID=1478 RepID=UPI003D2E7D0E
MSKLKHYLPTVLKGSAVLGTVAAAAYFYRKDDTQKQHSILRNFPLIGRIRYMTEQIGPELRQYLFENNNEGTPFSRKEFEDVVKAGKYKERLIGFGSERDFNEAGYYIRNSMFPNLREELRIDNSQKINTKVYEVDEEGLLTRKEKREDRQIEPYFLRDEDAVIIGGDTCRNPFKLKGLVGQSAMSYGALGENAITALSRGLGLAGGTWMNTGEGGLSKYHLSEQVKAFEIKLAQGAKIRGGHIEGQKVTEEIAQIRLVEPGQTINSPNRFYEFKNFNELFEFVERMRDVGGKPIGIKIVVGDLDALEEMTKTMRDTGKGPDFITVDGGEGGTGATYQELADAVGLPIMSALPLVDEMLKKYGVRNRVKLIASGKLTSPDKVAVALAMGADLVNIARGFMISVGCIMAEICHTNHCPAGVATTDSKLQDGLVIEEKQYRVANYVISLREGLFNLAAAAGIDTPTKFERKHIVHKDEWGRVSPVRDITLTPEKVEKLRNKEKVEK